MVNHGLDRGIVVSWNEIPWRTQCLLSLMVCAPDGIDSWKQMMKGQRERVSEKNVKDASLLLDRILVKAVDQLKQSRTVKFTYYLIIHSHSW
jgi:hypothetical protein